MSRWGLSLHNMHTTVQLFPSEHAKQKPQRHFVLNQIIPQIIQFPWHRLLSSCLLYSASSWMTDHAHMKHAIPRVFTAQILSELKLIWHILQTDLVFIQQTVAHEGYSRKTGTLILIGVKRANIFVITLACIGCSQSQRRDPGNLFCPHMSISLYLSRLDQLPIGNRKMQTFSQL